MMAAKGKVRLNRGTIKRILMTQDGGKRAAAASVLARIDTPGAEIDVYTTDREVVGVKVPFSDQALHGTATRAASRAGLTQGRP